MGICTLSLERGTILNHKSDHEHSDNDWLTISWLVDGVASGARTYRLVDRAGFDVLNDGSELAPIAASIECDDAKTVMATAVVLNLGSVDRDKQVDVANAFARDAAVKLEELYLSVGAVVFQIAAAAGTGPLAIAVTKAIYSVLQEFEDQLTQATRALFDDEVGPFMRKFIEDVAWLLGGQPNCNGTVLNDTFVFFPGREREEWVRDKSYQGPQQNSHCGLPPHTQLTWWVYRDVAPAFTPLGHQHVPGLIWALTPRMAHTAGHPETDHLVHDLLWYNHLGSAIGAADWNGPRKLGFRWDFNQIFPGVNGILYAVDAEGALRWYRCRGFRDGTAQWIGPRTVGGGWTAPLRNPAPHDLLGAFCDTRIDVPGHIFVNPFEGLFHPGTERPQVIYAVHADGSLWWYAHEGYATGEPTWANNGEGKRLSDNWVDGNQRIFSGGYGVLYVIKTDGSLRWFQHTGSATGEDTWLGGYEVGHGWQDMRNVFSLGDGHIYAVDADGVVWWYQHDDWANGGFTWRDRKRVGQGWNANGLVVVANTLSLLPTGIR